MGITSTKEDSSEDESLPVDLIIVAVALVVTLLVLCGCAVCMYTWICKRQDTKVVSMAPTAGAAPSTDAVAMMQMQMMMQNQQQQQANQQHAQAMERQTTQASPQQQMMMPPTALAIQPSSGLQPVMMVQQPMPSNVLER